MRLPCSKAQLEDWNSNTLLGAFLFLKEREADARQLDEWSYRGGSAFASEKTTNMSS